MHLTFCAPPKRFQELYDEVWKQGKAFIGSYEGVPVLEEFVTRLAHRQVILVRDEYRCIWKHIQSQRTAALDAGRRDSEGLVINGQSGIGKSLFLYYALAAALRARIPVVLCKHREFCYVFDATGFKRFWFSHGEPLDVPEHTLYLVDCGLDLSSPPSILLDRTGLLVTTGTPIHNSGWQLGNLAGRTSFWMMSVWTRAEMEALQRTLEALTHTFYEAPVYTPLDLFDLLGPSARQCTRFAGISKTPAGPRADLRPCARDGCLWIFSHLDAVLSAPRSRPLPGELFLEDDLDGVLVLALALTSHPNPNPNPDPESAGPENPSRVPEFDYAVPTLLLRQILTDYLLELAPFITSRKPHDLAADVLARSPSLARGFYQSLLVDSLLETRPGCVCHIVDLNVSSDDDAMLAPKGFCLGPGLELLHRAIELGPGGASGSQADPDIKDECILVPRAGFTAFDVVVVSGGMTRVTMLRAAVGNQALELVEPDDAEAIRGTIDLFDRVLPRREAVKWYFVYTALDEDRARSLAEREDARGMLVRVDPRLRGGWMKVDSRRKDVRAVLNALETDIDAREEESREERPAKRVRYE